MGIFPIVFPVKNDTLELLMDLLDDFRLTDEEEKFIWVLEKSGNYIYYKIYI